MKKFLFETVLLFILVAFTINYIDTLDQPPRVKQMLDIQEKLDIINLGTSHGNNFNYSGLAINGKLLNRAGNTLYYDLQNYKFVKKHLADSAIILLPISYFSFGLDENRADKGADKSFVNDFYEYLPKKSIYAYSPKRDISLKVNRIQKNFRSLIPKKKVAKKEPKKKRKKVIPFDTVAHAAMLKDFAIKRVVHHKKIGSFIPPEKNINYLNTLIEDAKQSGYRPVLITVPYYKEYVERFEADWLAEHYDQYMTQLSKQHNIPYIDYGFDKRFTTTPELFKNSDHLNKKGIAMFNAILIEDLVKLGMISEVDVLQKKSK
jgi:hypothetical protein